MIGVKRKGMSAKTLLLFTTLGSVALVAGMVLASPKPENVTTLEEGLGPFVEASSL